MIWTLGKKIQLKMKDEWVAMNTWALIWSINWNQFKRS